MVTFRSNNNNRRNNFRRNDRSFKPNGDRPKYGSNFSNSESFQRKVPGRNNHNASKLIEKYNNLAREALASEDKILSENYFQHADHFTRILNEQESYKKSRFSNEITEEKKDMARGAGVVVVGGRAGSGMGVVIGEYMAWTVELQSVKFTHSANAPQGTCRSASRKEKAPALETQSTDAPSHRWRSPWPHSTVVSRP